MKSAVHNWNWCLYGGKREACCFTHTRLMSLRSIVRRTAGRAATRELAELVSQESQRDATTENTPVNGGGVTAAVSVSTLSAFRFAVARTV